MYFYGESFPLINTDFGPGNLATFLGSEPRFEYDTVWYMPSNIRPDDCETLTYDPDNRWWKTQKHLVETGVKHSRERYIIGMPDLIEGLDTLASLRGTTNLLLDLYKHPRYIHEKLAEITELYFKYFDEIYELIRDEDGGNCYGAFSVWGPGKTAKVQCDISAIISPKMFMEFVVPYLKEQCSKLDYSVYHLDGNECIKHLDLLLDIDELMAIQWTPGYGKPDTGSRIWFKMYKKILNSGKSLLIQGVHYKKIDRIYNAVGNKGILIGVEAVSSKAEAEELLLKVKY
jgi:5-methyltetrahydrofolate--homocysteine methyltransferase